MNIPPKEELYPFLFEPYYKTVLWGGTRIKTVLNRPLPEDADHVGEAWDICDRPGMESKVTNGALAGTTIHQLIEWYGPELIGPDFKGGRFPLMVKIIDSNQNLSLQVHPDENYCAEKGGGCEPKTEMWYVLSAEKNAKIYVGLKSTTTRQKFLEHLNSAEMENDIQSFDSAAGDAYFIKAGRPHMIGAGNLLLEIQQNSDTTYRVYDWNRLGPDGKPRELHLEQAVACTDFMDRTVARISGVSGDTDHNRKYPIINRCQFFYCEDLKLVSEWRSTTIGQPGSFHILTAVNAPFNVGNTKFRTEVQPGSSVLIPACFGEYTVKVSAGITTSIVRTTL
ncbi:MAG: class I mannose-6-phosphate isomerase [Lentisphaeria bacterium]|nr:class I mannose-6-phosphate isomerase [Lentisphaeria bacterium]